jgi:protein phosphatase
MLFAAVADGMGGPAGGERASMIAAERVYDYWKSLRGDISGFDPISELKSAVLDANMEVYETAAESVTYSRMGTTLAVAVVINMCLYYAWVGDTRIYLLRKGEPVCLTKDHTRAQDMVDIGILSKSQYSSSSRSKELTRYIGADEFVAVDTNTLHLVKGDLIFIATDGVFEGITDTELRSLLERSLTPETILSRLMDDNGIFRGSDDRTVVVAKIR